MRDGDVTATALVSAALDVPADAAAPAERSVSGPTPPAPSSGSQRNGSSYLKLSLQTTNDGQILVSWKRPAPPSTLVRFVVKVGINRSMDAQVRSYGVNRTKQSVVVPPAFGVTRAPATSRSSRST